MRSCDRIECSAVASQLFPREDVISCLDFFKNTVYVVLLSTSAHFNRKFLLIKWCMKKVDGSILYEQMSTH
jgi:hypothetical protein